ncbi:hypothetical protein AV530_000774 [Patagioenas fasciata monilis]|uniref:Uncharacterized protein n=1 Tax=Patagioenas fasciata monilis TaxID=372326 RepID=A0A1V4KS61_PATFA|nr:hypothetical protein AV530_000774 [Patagioenas fasciata monilis]
MLRFQLLSPRGAAGDGTRDGINTGSSTTSLWKFPETSEVQVNRNHELAAGKPCYCVISLPLKSVAMAVSDGAMKITQFTGSWALL